MTTEEILKLLMGGSFTLCFGLLAFYAKGLLSDVKALTSALQENAHEVGKLTALVENLVKENNSLRQSHEKVTQWLISKGIIQPNDL